MQKITLTDKIKITIVLAITAVALVGIIWYLTQLILDKYYLSKDSKYSIMTRIFSGGSDGKGHTSRLYYFVVNSKKYSGQAGGSYSIKKIYFVKFYPPDPSRNEAVLVEATEYDIAHLPTDGYKMLPHH